MIFNDNYLFTGPSKLGHIHILNVSVNELKLKMCTYNSNGILLVIPMG